MNQLSFNFAQAELTTLDQQCREAFERGSGFHPVHPEDMVHLIWTHFEYHRLSELRREARERIAAYRAQHPANDVSAEATPYRATCRLCAAPLNRQTGAALALTDCPGCGSRSTAER